MTQYARIEDGAIAEITRNPRTGLLTYATVAELQALGWVEIVDTPRPATDPTGSHSRTVEVVDGVPTVVWTLTPYAQEQLDQQAAEAADAAERQQIKNALATLDNIIDSADSMNNAQIRAAVGYLARVCRRLVKDML